MSALPLSGTASRLPFSPCGRRAREAPDEGAGLVDRPKPSDRPNLRAVARAPSSAPFGGTFPREGGREGAVPRRAASAPSKDPRP